MAICNNEILIAMNSSNKYLQKVIDEKESADYFFHYTTNIEYLISIMNNFFMPFYCMESIEYLNMPELQLEGMAYPVVCFCDLPLNRHKKHKSKFGDYGIGMKKEWGINNHLTPVVYTHTNSMTTSSMRILFDIARSLKGKLSEDEYRKYNWAVSPLLMHYKPYEGKQYIKKDKLFADKITRFYDEREWRYIPLNMDGLKLNLEMHEYQDTITLNEENKKIQRANRLKFELNDIEFLFLRNKAEIDSFLSKLSQKYTDEDKNEIKRKIYFD